VVRLRFRFSLILLFCVSGFGGFAQDMQSPPNAAQSAGSTLKAPAKKSPKKAKGAARLTPPPASEEAEKAARLAEGRKKFFEQSSGFENEKSDMPFSLGGSGGATPSIGMKF
jgi:hypothetical protein